MDSELTLVSLAPPTPYFLSSTDLTDAVIFTHPGVPLYSVTSDAKHIRICSETAPNRLIAILHRRDIFSDSISFPQRHGGDGTSTGTRTQTNIHRWLRRYKTSDGTPAFTVDTEYGPCVWKAVSGNQHKVFADYDLDHPVASCYLHQFLPRGNPAFILESAGEPLRDDIVVAYLVLRHRLRMENNTLDLFIGRN